MNYWVLKHNTKDCPHLEDVRSYIDFEPNKIKSKR